MIRAGQVTAQQVYGLTIFVACVFLCGTGFANIFARFPGIPGNSNFKGREDWIEIQAYGVFPQPGQGIDVSIAREIDSASVRIWERFLDGRQFDRVTIDVASTIDPSVTEIQIDFRQVSITGISSDVSAFGAIERLSFFAMELGDGSLDPILGDFNADRQLTIADLDLLNIASNSQPANLRFDVNDDQQVDVNDVHFWVEELKNTYIGDADLDGLFDSRDFVQVFRIGEFEDGIENNSTWAEGDWDADRDFGTGDLVAAFQAGGYGSGPMQAARSVPEFQGVFLVFAIYLACWQASRQRVRSHRGQRQL